MTDYQRMPDQNSKNQIPTTLNNSDEEDVSVKKTKAVSLARAPVPVEEKKNDAPLAQSQKMEKKLNEKEQAQQKEFENFKKQTFPLVRTDRVFEYKDYCFAYNNQVIYVKNEILLFYDEGYFDIKEEDKHKFYVYQQTGKDLQKPIDEIMKKVREHRETGESEDQEEGGEESDGQQQQESKSEQDSLITFVESFPDLYKIVLGTKDGDVIVLSAIDFSYENSYQTEKGPVIDIVASKKHIFSMHENDQGKAVCKLNISSKKIDDFEELQKGKEGEILAMKISPNKRWLAYVQELRKITEEEGKEQLNWDLVIKDVDFAQEKIENSDEDEEYGEQSQQYSECEGGQDDSKESDEIRYPVKIYTDDTKERDRQKEFGAEFRPYPVLQQIKDLFEFTPNSQNIVTRVDLKVVKSFLVDKVETNAVVEKLCGDKSRVLKLQILSDNMTLICMSGGDKDLVEDIKMINLESTKKQIKLGCSDPLDFCCSKDMIFVVDADPKLKKSCIKGFDQKSQTQLINHINLDLAFLSTDISPDSNYLYINEYDKNGYLSYLKLSDYQMAIEEKDIIMDSSCQFLMQYTKKTGFCELWDLQNNRLKAVYPKSYPICVSGDYFYAISDSSVKKQIQNQVYRVNVRSLDLKQELCSALIDNEIQMVQVTEDNKILYIMDESYFISYNTQNSEEIDRYQFFQSNYPENYVTFQLSHDAKYMIYVSDTEGYKFNLDNGKFEEEETAKRFELNWYLTKFDAFSPDGTYLLARQFYTDRFEKFDLEKLKTTKVIKGHKKDKVLHCCFAENGKNLVSMTAKQLIYWEINGDDFHIVDQIDKPITPIYGYNKQMTGLRVDGTLYPWSKHLIFQLSGNFPELAKCIEEYEKQAKSDPKCASYLKSLNYTQGPYNRLSPFVFNYFETFEDEDDLDKISMIKHMLQNVISPQGFTFLGYLAQTNKQSFIKEALQYQPMYFRDFNGNFPLTLALKKQSITTVNMLVEFVAKDSRLVEQLNHEEVCMLLEFSPSNLPQLINNSISKIRGAAALGIDKNEDLTDFITTQNILPDKLHDKLCNTEANEVDKKLVVYKNVSFKLNLIPGSDESVRFHECLADCTESEVFNSDAIKYILEYKWQKLQKNTQFPMFISIGFLAALLVHVYTPGRLLPLYFLLAFAFFLLVIEFYKFIAGGFKYVNKFNIILIGLLPIYFFQTVNQPTKYTDYILPLCNLLSCINLTRQLRSLSSIRAFMVVLVESITSLKAFFSFFMLMLLTFTFTLLIQKKVKDRWRVFDKKIQHGQDSGNQFDMTYSTKLYESVEEIDGEQIKLTQEGFSEILNELWEVFYDSYLKMLGEFGDIGPADYNYFEMVVFILLTFVLCITLLNLVIAIMSSAYEEFKEQKTSKEQRELNKIILVEEIKLASQRNKNGSHTYLIWMEYQEENAEKKSEIAQVNEMMGDAQVQLKKIISDAKNQDDKIEKISSAQTLLQKEVVQINTSLTELIKLIKKDSAPVQE